MVILADAAGAPFSVTVELKRTSVDTCFTLRILPLTRLRTVVVTLRFVTVSLTCVGMWRSDCTSTEPAGFGRPAVGTYGVQSDVQR